ncbi:MAG: hypothetical protein HC822_24710 [Oscillochloris sp.]|nr:hypothetical protein [Oscillochloris sp.]
MNLAKRYTSLLSTYPAQVITIAGRRWELIAAGAGRSVLLLPGGFGVAATSFQYIADLARDYRVLALTYPPHLDRIAELADGVVAVLDACGVARSAVVGGSASGAVAQVLVRRHPSRVAALILAQTGPPQPQRARRARICATWCKQLPAPLTLALLRWAIFGFLPKRNAEHAFWRTHFAAVVGAQDRAALAARFHALADYDRNYVFTPADLAAWRGNIAIIESSADAMIAHRERTALRELYPRATLHTLAAGRHADSVTDPQPQLALIRAILHTAAQNLP